MKVKLSLLFPFLALASLATVSCKKDKPACEGNFQNGVFISAEGPFQNGTGTVTFSNDDLADPCQDIFGTLNGGAALGNIVQSMTLIGGKAWLVVNNSNKIVVVDTKTFAFEAEITGFAQPRYLLDLGGGKAAVSQWGDGFTGSVAIVDLTNRKILKTIEAVGGGCERMLRLSDELWVTNSGGFGNDSTIAVINLTSETKTKSIPTGKNSNSLVKAADGNIWVIGKGFIDYFAQIFGPGELTLLTPAGAFIRSIPLSNGAEDLIQNAAGDLFFNESGTIQKLPASSSLNDSEKFADGYFYEIAVSPTGEIWATDAKDFASPGEVSVFKTDGSVRKKVAAGIIPGCIVFQ